MAGTSPKQKKETKNSAASESAGEKGTHQISKMADRISQNHAVSEDCSDLKAHTINYKQMALEVANLINPTIEKSIEIAVKNLQSEINKIMEQVTSHNALISEMEERISSLEDYSSSAKSKIRFLEKKISDLENKTEDLENRSRRNNLRFVERAHRVGPGKDLPHQKPRTVLVKFLDYSDKTLILQTYKKSKNLYLEKT
uniref:Uncharacterized protein n=1 Tax=Xenopus tropicalis TaxID=8364 RepID=A0A1B8Y4H1_XENTR